jgi:hypothetical protein
LHTFFPHSTLKYIKSKLEKGDVYTNTISSVVSLFEGGRSGVKSNDNGIQHNAISTPLKQHGSDTN